MPCVNYVMLLFLVSENTNQGDIWYPSVYLIILYFSWEKHGMSLQSDVKIMAASQSMASCWSVSQNTAKQTIQLLEIAKCGYSNASCGLYPNTKKPLGKKAFVWHTIQAALHKVGPSTSDSNVGLFGHCIIESWGMAEWLGKLPSKLEILVEPGLNPSQVRHVSTPLPSRSLWAALGQLGKAENLPSGVVGWCR